MATGRWLAKQRVRSVFIYKRNEQLSLSSCQTWKVIKVQQTTQRGQPSGLGRSVPSRSSDTRVVPWPWGLAGRLW